MTESPVGIVLRYIGEGLYVAGVPACDLTQQMIDDSGYTVEELLAFHDGDRPCYVRNVRNQE